MARASYRKPSFRHWIPTQGAVTNLSHSTSPGAPALTLKPTGGSAERHPVDQPFANEPFPETADSRAFQRAKRRNWIELGIALATGIGFCVMLNAFYSILTQQ